MSIVGEILRMENCGSETAASSGLQIDRAILLQLVAKLLQRKGMFAAEAEIVASRMIEADQLGFVVHGVASLVEYLDAMDLGDIDPRARIITVSDSPAVALLDGSTGIGHVAVTRAMLLAIEKARVVGSGTVVIKNSRSCGDLGVFARLAADVGLLGHVSSGLLPSIDDELDEPISAWGFPAASSASSMIVRERRSDLGEPSLLAHAVVSAGLAGGDAPPRKRKATRVANTAEYFVQALDPDKFSSRDLLLAKWGPAMSACNAGHAEPDISHETVSLQSDVARVLSELAAKIKFVVNW